MDRPFKILSIDGGGDTVDVDFQAQQLCGEGRYYRFQATLDIGNDDMDDASATNIHARRLVAKRVIEDRGDDLDELCAALTETPPASGVA